MSQNFPGPVQTGGELVHSLRGYFRTQCFEQPEGRSYLIKQSTSDEGGADDALLEHEYRVFEEVRSDRMLRQIGRAHV